MLPKPPPIARAFAHSAPRRRGRLVGLSLKPNPPVAPHVGAEGSSLETRPDIERLCHVSRQRPAYLGNVEGVLRPLQITALSDEYIQLSALNRFSDGFSRFPGDLPGEAFGNGVLYAEGISSYPYTIQYRRT